MTSQTFAKANLASQQAVNARRAQRPGASFAIKFIVAMAIVAVAAVALLSVWGMIA